MNYLGNSEIKDVNSTQNVSTIDAVGIENVKNDNIIDLAKNITSSGMDADKAANVIEDFRKRQAVRLSNVYIFGPMMLWYAYRGKLTKIERGLLLLMGASSMYLSYQDWKKRSPNASYFQDLISSFTKNKVSNENSQKQQV